MQPEQTPQPQQPQSPPPAVPQTPQPVPISGNVPQPAATPPQPVTTPPPVQSADVKDPVKEKRYALFYGIGSIAILVLGLLFGFAGLIGIALGAWAIKIGKPVQATTAIVLGAIGMALNTGLLLLVIFVG